MGRKSPHSNQNYLAATSLKPYKPSSTQSLQDQLIETKLRIEQAKLAKLEAELPKDEPKYMRYEDMPPPTPEDEARFEAEFQEIMRSIFAQRDEDEKWNGGPEKGQSVQDWLIEEGATIPDHPDWQTPLYMEYPSKDLDGGD